MRWSRAGLSFLCCPIFLVFYFHPTRELLWRGWWAVPGPGAYTCHRVHSAFFRRIFFDWNTHFVVFSGSVEQGLGGPTARSSWKIRQNGGWEARRLDPVGMIIPPAAPGTRADEGGGPSQGFLYGCFFYLKWRWALNQEITDSAAQQGWCTRPASCNSCAFTTLLFVMGKCALLEQGLGGPTVRSGLRIRQNRG